MEISRFKVEENKRFLWFVRGGMNSTHEQYHRKHDKKKSEREKRKHASMLKILNNFINQLQFPLNTFEHKYIQTLSCTSSCIRTFSHSRTTSLTCKLKPNKT